MMDKKRQNGEEIVSSMKVSKVSFFPHCCCTFRQFISQVVDIFTPFQFQLWNTSQFFNHTHISRKLRIFLTY